MRLLLSELALQHFGETAKTPFPAMNGQPVLVTALLDRTAVIQVGRVEDKRVIRQDLLSVDPAHLDWIKPTGRSGQAQRAKARRRGQISSLVTQKAMRAASAERLLDARAALRLEGKRCCGNPRCRHIGLLVEFNTNGYCKPCAVAKNRQSRSAS